MHDYIKMISIQTKLWSCKTKSRWVEKVVTSNMDDRFRLQTKDTAHPCCSHLSIIVCS